MKILFLSTWFPYPLNQGSKLRAYYLLKALTQKHEVALVSYEDAPIKEEWLIHMKELCPVVEILERQPFHADKEKTWVGWFSSRPSAVVAIYSQGMADLVERVASEWKPDYVVSLTFVTAPYALLIENVPRVLDVDNFMTRMLYEAYELEERLLSKLRRWLAYKKFERYEEWLCPQFDHCLVVTDEDRKALVDLVGEQTTQIDVVSNGVDVSSHQSVAANPTPNTLIYNGALTYQANYDAMQYFLSEIFPLIIKQVPDVKLRITGKTDGVAIDQLPITQHVEFTGYLDDIRPAVAQSWACPVPLRIGGGTRLKILEAMALRTPVISTSKGAEGLDVEAGKHLLIADAPEDFASQTVRLFHDPELREHLANNAMKLITQKYEWKVIGQEFAGILES